MALKNEDLHFDSKQELLKRFCAFQERANYDVKIKAKRIGMTAAETEQSINLLTEQGFLDERRYVEAFVRGKMKYNKWGKIKIRAELRAKSISQTLIDEYINAVDQDEYMDILSTIISKKALTLQANEHEKNLMKLERYALSKGFEHDLVFKVVHEFLKV